MQTACPAGESSPGTFSNVPVSDCVEGRAAVEAVTGACPMPIEASEVDTVDRIGDVGADVAHAALCVLTSAFSVLSLCCCLCCKFAKQATPLEALVAASSEASHICTRLVCCVTVSI